MSAEQLHNVYRLAMIGQGGNEPAWEDLRDEQRIAWAALASIWLRNLVRRHEHQA